MLVRQLVDRWARLERGVVFCFGDFEVDEARFELRHRCRVVPVQPKVLELLLHLLRNRGRVVPQAELLAAVWPDARVTAGSLARAVSLARAALDDREREPPVIVTVARRGYRFEAEVREREDGGIASRVPATPYVGRASLVARLEERLAGALAGDGRILLLAGEGGIGKTRTAELLAARAARSGALVAWATGAEDGSPPLGSWGQALRDVASRAPSVPAALTPGRRAVLAGLLPELGSAAVDSGARGDDARRFALRDAVEAFLAGACRAAPVALFLEDLHAADAETLGLLESIGHTVASLPLAIVATCREEDGPRTPRGARALERLLRLTTLERWPLAGLERSEVGELARRQLGGEVEGALIDALEGQTSGNPLLIVEGLRSLEARSLLGRARSRREWEALLPRGVRHLLLPKLWSLSPEAREVVACAAALGREVDPRVVEGCVEEGTPVAAGLAEAIDATLLLPSVDGGFVRFSHALVREAVHAELLPVGPRRRSVHARISRVLEARGAPSAEELAERALHASEGVPLIDADHAAALAASAAAFAARQLDFEGAVGWYERALALIGSRDPARRATLLLGLGDAQIRALGLDRARPSLRAAADEARAIGRPELFAAAALGFAHRPSSTGRGDAAAIGLLEEADEQLAPDDPLGIRVRSRLSVELRYAESTRAERLMDAALVAARRLGEAPILAQVLDDSSFVHWSPADSEAWCALNAEVCRVARECRDLELELSGRRGVLTGRLEQGRRAALDRETAACAATATALGTPHAHWFRRALEAMQSLLAGDLDVAERRIVDAMTFGARLDADEVAVELGAQLAYLRLEQGRGVEMADAVRTQVERFPSNTGWRAALALLLADGAGAARAWRELEPLARRHFEDVPRDRGTLPTLAMAAAVAHAAGEQRAASHLVAQLAPYADLHVVVGSGLLYFGAVSHALGLATAGCGRLDESIEHFERAITQEEALGARLWAAHARVDCAAVLIARNGAGDRSRAAALAHDGLEAARRHGWTRVAARGAGLEAALWRQRPRGARRSLTRSER